jgi:hypothetical protein
MPSHLTRVVFRSILANEPLLYRGCRHRPLRPSLITHYGARALPQPQRRTLFGNFFKSQRKIKKMDMPEGLETMSELSHAQQIAARPPTPKDVAAAFKSFFATKRGTLEDFHVRIAHNAFVYLIQHPQHNGDPWFTRQELMAILSLLARKDKRPDVGGKPHVQFGSAVVEQVKTMPVVEETSDPLEEPLKYPKLTDQEVYNLRVRPKLVRIYAIYGEISLAREIVTTSYNDYSTSFEARKKVILALWHDLFTGASRHANIDEMIELAEAFKATSLPLTENVQAQLVEFFASRQRLETAKYWYSQPTVTNDGHPGNRRQNTYVALLTACALEGDLDFGQGVVAGLTKEHDPRKTSWDAIFLWSAALGKGVDEIERMMNVMVRRSEQARQEYSKSPLKLPDIDTINLLIEFAMSKQDSYSAERYIALAEKRGILLNEHTFTMQMQYRLSIKDLDGARAAYYNLQGDFKGSESSVAAINELVQALCDSKKHPYDDIMAIVDDLLERKARFAPETIAKLCILHLRRVEIHDAMDLLQVHAHQYSPVQRAVIIKSLYDFILDKESSTADAWDAYQILRNTFPETSRDDRIRLMNEFFARNRSDMACHVFFHMRNHTAESHSANREVYVAAFTGFARCTDAESLELVNNQLKLDFKVELDTKLRNALMLAHATCGNNKKALEFWREICESKEGPSYNSIAIAFRSCEGMPWGDEHAKSIWARLKQQDVEIDKNIFVAYLSAIARNFLHDEALALVETVEDEYGYTPDLHMYVYT